MPKKMTAVLFDQELSEVEIRREIREALRALPTQLERRLSDGYERLNACGHFDESDNEVDSTLLDDKIPDEHWDFRASIDDEQKECRHQCPCCKEDFNELGICAVCSHPDLQVGEICLAACMDVELFHMLDIKTKRAARAFSSEGTLLSDKFRSVMIARSEMEEIVLRASLPIAYFE